MYQELEERVVSNRDSLACCILRPGDNYSYEKLSEKEQLLTPSAHDSRKSFILTWQVHCKESTEAIKQQ